MINKLKNNSKIKIISLLSAMVLWMYVMAIVDPEETKLFENNKFPKNFTRRSTQAGADSEIANQLLLQQINILCYEDLKICKKFVYSRAKMYCHNVLT